MSSAAGARAPAHADGLVGIVVVSHSHRLASAALELAEQMVHDRGPRTAVAAGLADQTLGTDAMAIQAAIEQVDGPAGVVVLMDLGSAVLSAELALDLADDAELRERVTLSPAPLVEGLVAALVTAAGGGSRTEVAAEAANALAAKRAQLAIPDAEPERASTPSTQAAPQNGQTAELSIGLEHGLHARPVARLVGEVRGLDATVSLVNLATGAGPAAATSPTQLALLGALQGHRLRVEAQGPDAAEAVRRLVALAGRGFDEGPQLGANPVGAQPVSTALRPGQPLGASPGIVLGPVRHLRAAPSSALVAPVGDPGEERDRLAAALDSARTQITGLRARTSRDVGERDARIFDAHLALLGDPSLLDDARRAIDEGSGAAEAWMAAVQRVEHQLADLPDPYLRARAADLRAVGDQVLRAMGADAEPVPSGVGVLVADDLTPAQVAALDVDTVQAVVLAQGSRTSHAVILARSRAIPLVLNAGRDVLAVPEGTPVALDGDTGALLIDPDADVRVRYEEAARAQRQDRRAALAGALAPAATLEGRRIQVACNVASVADAAAGAEQGADGAGLVRTELCFVGRAEEPDVEEQEALYLAIASALEGRPMTIRTLDVGGDKPLGYLPVPHEDNPFLGLRGLRLSLVHEPVLRRQLTAITRAARKTPVRVMFPMVSMVSELRQARSLLSTVLAAENLTAAQAPPVGIMVEVPAVALKLHAFTGLLDFVSIGTNDLTQYALAAERGNAHVAALADPLDPGVLALIDATVRAARGHFPVAVCGEAAADVAAVPLLLGLGVSELSLTPYAVPAVKQLVRGLRLAGCARLAEQALRAESAEQVRTLVQDSAAAH